MGRFTKKRLMLRLYWYFQWSMACRFLYVRNLFKLYILIAKERATLYLSNISFFGRFSIPVPRTLPKLKKYIPCSNKFITFRHTGPSMNCFKWTKVKGKTLCIFWPSCVVKINTRWSGYSHWTMSLNSWEWHRSLIWTVSVSAENNH